MDKRFTILWDPRSCGDLQFFDRIFYTDSTVAFSRVSELNSNSLFHRFFVYEVSFKLLDNE